ncbi:MAG: helix-turn-helix transcriptional regulator [Thermogutta sp.]|nr:helix-turn-helix transcriptional regulator [Thermogutta sp.]
MDAETKARCEMTAEVFRALAHPSRVFIVEQLAKHGEKCVCEMTALIGADMSTVSRHLSALKKAGVVEDERRGTMTFYRLRTPCVLKFLQCAERVLRENYQAKVQMLK